MASVDCEFALSSRVARYALMLLAILTGCGGSSPHSAPLPVSIPQSDSVVAISISPTSVEVWGGGTQQFTASVTGTANKAVTWSIDVCCGSITQTGLYTATNNEVLSTYRVIATSQADPSKTAVATVKIPDMVVSLTPSSATIDVSTKMKFTATVTGNVDPNVSWSVGRATYPSSNECGQFDVGTNAAPEAYYTAPSHPATCSVVVWSEANANKTATASITVTSNVGVTIDPPSATVRLGQSFQFVAKVTGTTITDVMWLGAGPTGVFVQYHPGPYTITAISRADTTKKATASVLVPGVLVSPTSANLLAGETKQFSTTLFGVTNPAVTWAVQPGGVGGTVNSSGLYTAPAVLGTDSVVATSVEDPSLSANAAVQIVVPVQIVPGDDLLATGGRRDFEAVIRGSGGAKANWSIVEGASGGTITAVGDSSSSVPYVGRYDAPANPGTYHIQATSPSDPSLTGQTSVTVVPNGFRPAADQLARFRHTATVLPDGRVFIVGGEGQLISASDGSFPQLTSEIFDPATETFGTSGSMSGSREAHTATLLPNGKVLVAGGLGHAAPDHIGFMSVYRASAEVWDSATGAFTMTGNMSTARVDHTAVGLRDGRVLVAGGSAGSGAMVSAELYDPDTGAFTLTGAMQTPRVWLPDGAAAPHAGDHAFLLTNGQVLIIGGDSANTMELYDPTSGAFTGLAPLPFAQGTRFVQLPDRRLIAVSGHSPTSIELWDPTAGTVAPLGNTTLNSPSYPMLLSDGRLLLVGCDSCTENPTVAEVFDPVSGVATRVGGPWILRLYATLTPLPGNRALFPGGGVPFVVYASAEVFK
jgi:hypothetical protein